MSGVRRLPPRDGVTDTVGRRTASVDVDASEVSGREAPRGVGSRGADRRGCGQIGRVRRRVDGCLDTRGVRAGRACGRVGWRRLVGRATRRCARPGGPGRPGGCRGPGGSGRSGGTGGRTCRRGLLGLADGRRRSRRCATVGSATTGRGGRQRGLVLLDAREDRQAGRGCECPRRRVAGDDRQALLVGQGIAGEQPEVDPRRRDARAVRQHDRDPARLDGPDARGSRGDLVIDVEIEDAVRHVRPSSHAGRAGGRHRGRPRWSGVRWPDRRGRAASRPAGRRGATSRPRWCRSGRAT